MNLTKSRQASRVFLRALRLENVVHYIHSRSDLFRSILTKGGNMLNEKTALLIVKTQKRTLDKISQSVNWENYQNENGTYWHTKQALYCQMTWLQEYLEDQILKGDENAEEHVSHLNDVLLVLQVLPLDGKEIA